MYYCDFKFEVTNGKCEVTWNTYVEKKVTKNFHQNYCGPNFFKPLFKPLLMF